MKPMTRIWLRMRRRALKLLGDKRGVAAVEFAVIVPVMLVLFFGMDEFSSGVAVDRKVTLMARTLSDLTSQNTSGHRYPADQLLQCQQRDHDALSVGAGQSPRSRNSISIPHDEGAGAMEQGRGAACGRHHGRHPDRAKGWQTPI